MKHKQRPIITGQDNTGAIRTIRLDHVVSYAVTATAHQRLDVTVTCGHTYTFLGSEADEVELALINYHRVA